MPKTKRPKSRLSATLQQSSYERLCEIAALCGLSQGQTIDALVREGAERVLKLYGQTK